MLELLFDIILAIIYGTTALILIQLLWKIWFNRPWCIDVIREGKERDKRRKRNRRFINIMNNKDPNQ